LPILLNNVVYVLSALLSRAIRRHNIYPNLTDRKSKADLKCNGYCVESH